jgi:tetratricopeptide (TPR) repeat protein
LLLLDTEEGNLWSALDWATQIGRVDIAGRFVWALLIYWWIRGRRDAGRRVTAQVLSAEASDAVRARALHAAAALSEPGVDPPEKVERLYLDSLALAERCGEHEVVAPSAIGAGLIALERGDSITAEARLRHGLSAAERVGERGEWSAVVAQTWLATTRRFQADPAGAIAHANQALTTTRRRGDVLGHCIALYDLGQAELDMGEHDRARGHLVEAVTLCQQTRDATNLSYLLDALATVELKIGGRERVVTLLGAAQALRELARSAVYRWYAPDIELRDRTAAAACESLGEDAYQRAFDAGLSLTLDGAVEFARREVPTR